MSTELKKAEIRLRRFIISAVFLSLALIMKLLINIPIPLFGENGIKVGMSGIFTSFPAILFGPLYGGAVSALSDLFGALIKPTGPYMPWFTITAFIGGFLKGLIWKLITNKNEKALRIVIALLFIAVGILGMFNSISLNADNVNSSYFEANSGENTEGLSLISTLLIKRALATKDPGASLATNITYTTWALIFFAILGLIALLIDLIVSKKFKFDLGKHSLFKITASLVLSGLVLTTINTVILRELVFASWKGISFMLVWIPRAIEEVVVCLVQSYFVAILFSIFLKYIYKNDSIYRI